MGTAERKEREKEIRRHQIQEAAKELFMCKGFGGTTMEDIASAAELSLGAIYQYYSSKEELYASLMLDAPRVTNDRIRRIHKNKRLSVVTKIFRVKEILYSAYQDDPLSFRSILHAQTEGILLSLTGKLLSEVNDLVKDSNSMIADILEDGVRQGKIRKGNQIARVDMILGIFFGLIVWEEAKRTLDPKKDFLKQTLDGAFEIFYRGIRRD